MTAASLLGVSPFFGGLEWLDRNFLVEPEKAFGCGDLARLVDSIIQCLSCASWLMIGYWRRRAPCRRKIP